MKKSVILAMLENQKFIAQYGIYCSILRKTFERLGLQMNEFGGDRDSASESGSCTRRATHRRRHGDSDCRGQAPASA